MMRTAMIVLSLFLCPLAYADVVTAESGGMRATLYAPDWVWKGQNLNFLVVLDNTSERSIAPALSMSVANAEKDEFAQATPQSESAVLAQGMSGRAAFANVATVNAVIGKTYNFVISIDDGTPGALPTPLTLNADVKVIRGSVVSGGKWAAFLPAGVAAAWCAVLALYFRRYAAAGAWKTPSAPVWRAET